MGRLSPLLNRLHFLRPHWPTFIGLLPWLLALLAWSDYRDSQQTTFVTNDLIYSRLTDILQELPDAGAARMNVINTRHYWGLADRIHDLTFTITHTVNNESRLPRITWNNEPGIPLSRWQPYISDLLRQQCSILYRHAENATPEINQRFDEFGLWGYIVCPVMDSDYHLLGAVFVNWPAGSGPTDAEHIDYAAKVVRRAANRIALYLQLQRAEENLWWRSWWRRD